MNIVQRYIIAINFISICFIFSDVQTVDDELTPFQNENNMNQIKEYTIDMDQINIMEIKACMNEPGLSYEYEAFTDYITFALDKLRTIKKEAAFCTIKACDVALKNAGFKYSSGEDNYEYALKRDLKGIKPVNFTSFQQGYWYHLSKTQIGGDLLEKRNTISWCLIQVLRDDLSKSVFKNGSSSMNDSSQIMSTVGFFAQEFASTSETPPNYAQEYEMMLKIDPSFAKAYVSDGKIPNIQTLGQPPANKKIRISEAEPSRIGGPTFEAGPSQSGPHHTLQPAAPEEIGGTSQAAEAQPQKKRRKNQKAAVPKTVGGSAQAADAQQVLGDTSQAAVGLPPKKRGRKPKADSLRIQFEGPIDILGSAQTGNAQQISSQPAQAAAAVPEILDMTAYEVTGPPRKKRGMRSNAEPSQSGLVHTLQPAVPGITGETLQAAYGPLQSGLVHTLQPVQRDDPMDIITLETADPGIIGDAAQAAEDLKKKKEAEKKRNQWGRNKEKLQAIKDKKAQEISNMRTRNIELLQQRSVQEIANQAKAYQLPGIGQMLGEKSDARLLNLPEGQGSSEDNVTNLNPEVRTNDSPLREPSARTTAMQRGLNQQPGPNLMFGGFGERSDAPSVDGRFNIDSRLQPEPRIVLPTRFSQDYSQQTRMRPTEYLSGQPFPASQLAIDKNLPRSLLQPSLAEQALGHLGTQNRIAALNRLSASHRQTQFHATPPFTADYSSSDTSHSAHRQTTVADLHSAALSRSVPSSGHTSPTRHNPRLSMQPGQAQMFNFMEEQDVAANVGTDLTLAAIGEKSDDVAANVRTDLTLGAIGEKSDDVSQQYIANTSGSRPRMYNFLEEQDFSRTGQSDTNLTLGGIGEKSDANVRTNNYRTVLANSYQPIDTNLTLGVVGGNSDDFVRTENAERTNQTNSNQQPVILDLFGEMPDAIMRKKSAEITEQSKSNQQPDTGLTLGVLGEKSNDNTQQGRTSISRLNSGAPIIEPDYIAQSGRDSPPEFGRMYSSPPNAVDDISQQGRTSTSGLNRISSAPPNATHEVRAISSRLNSINNFSQQRRVRTLGMDKIYSKSPFAVDEGIAGTSNAAVDTSGRGRASTSGFNNLSEQDIASSSELNRISSNPLRAVHANLPVPPNAADGKILVWATIQVCVDQIVFAREKVPYKTITMKYDFAQLYASYLLIQRIQPDSSHTKSPKDWCNHVYLKK